MTPSANDQQHDQLPSLEEAQMAAAKEHGASDQLKQRLRYAYMGLGVLATALFITIIIAASKGSNTDTNDELLSFKAMKTAIQTEAYPVLSFQKPSSYTFNEGSTQSQALSQVQSQAGTLTKTQTVELYALAVLYFATNKNLTWKEQKTWFNTPTNYHYCLWKGIRCDRNGQVAEIDLAEGGLGGNIPEEILMLKSLRHLDLQNNSDLGSGQMPPTWLMVRPNQLVTVDLVGTGYTGDVPDRVCDLKPTDMSFAVDCNGDDNKVTCNCCVGCTN